MANEINLTQLKIYLQEASQEALKEKPKDLDCTSWGYQDGVLISNRQAALFAHFLQHPAMINYLVENFNFQKKDTLLEGLVHLPAFYKDGKYHLGASFTTDINPLCGEEKCQPLNHTFFRGLYSDYLYKLVPKEFAKSSLSADEFLANTTEHEAVKEGWIMRLVKSKVDNICPICIDRHYAMFGQPNPYNA